jgi:hypothetical protein
MGEGRFRTQLRMMWSFSGTGSIRQLGLVGSEGEFYFHPAKKASIRAPQGVVGKTVILPMYFYSNVLTPRASDWLNIFEMKYRQMANDIGDEGSIGFVHYSSTIQKLSVVGTIGQIKEKKMMADGRTLAVVEGTKRFYVKEFIAEKPYPKARIVLFNDYCENMQLLKELEDKVFQQTRLNLKVSHMYVYIVGVSALLMIMMILWCYLADEDVVSFEGLHHEWRYCQICTEHIIARCKVSEFTNS